jgi:uncharacterized protein YcbK (DUF882 family)
MGDRILLPRRRPSLKRLLMGAAVLALGAIAGASHIIAGFGDSRTISLYNIHTKETTSVLFKQDGKMVPGAMDKINWALRDWRRDEKTSMDPALVDLLWEIHAELGSKEPIHIISAFRSRNTNDMLRKTVGGQASESRHILGKAADVHFPDVPLKNLRYSALIRERGGVGYYPTSALPFVHVDTDRVRHWPRLPRDELALLFPKGQSQHLPADGGPITIEDVRVARVKHRDLAVQVAEFHQMRTMPKGAVAVADARNARIPNTPGAPARTPPAAPLQQVAYAPQLIEAPRVIDRPSRFTTPSGSERARLSELARLASAEPASKASAPQLVAGPQPAQRRIAAPIAPPPSLTGVQIPSLATGFIEPPRVAALDPKSAAALTDAGFDIGFAQAPQFDEEHPDELSYRPFPIAPLLTATASADDPALLSMHHPDVAKTLEMLDQGGSMPPMKLRPTQQVAAMMLSQQFKGQAVNFTAIAEVSQPAAGTLAHRKVATSPR